MTDGGYTMTEARNLQLQGRNRELSRAIEAILKTCRTRAAKDWQINRIVDLAEQALKTNDAAAEDSSAAPVPPHHRPRSGKEGDMDAESH